MKGLKVLAFKRGPLAIELKMEMPYERKSDVSRKCNFDPFAFGTT